MQQLLETFKNWATEKPRRNYQFAIVQRQGSQLLAGCCGLRTADSESGKAELGIELAPEFWGRYGYAIEIMHDLVDFGLGSLKLSEIYGSTVSANARVARLARSLGAVATTRAYSSLDGCSGLEPNSLACHKRAMGEWHSNDAFNSDAPKAARALTQTLGEYFDDYRRQ